MTNIIELDGVTWKRGKKTILQKVDWSVNKGEHWAVLGLNGSGKTMLLNMVNGYIWPTTGKVSVLEKKFGTTDLRELRKSIGWVSSSLQERIKDNERPENIIVSGKYASIGLYVKPTVQDFKRAEQLMNQLDCIHLQGRTYQTCSQGEKQKILIARGLMGAPELLILDEPTNGLDFIAREELLETIQQLTKQEEAPTLIFVTHHIEEILSEFTHTLLLRNGSVFDKGRREDMLTNEKLSTFYNKPVEVEWKKDRAWMSAMQ